MSMEDINRQRKALEQKAERQVRESLEKARDEACDNNNTKEEVAEPEFLGEEKPPVEKAEPKVASPKPLIYFSYPMSGYATPPVWTKSLKDILTANGYLVFNPWETLDEAYVQDDIPFLNMLDSRLVKSLCPLLFIPEETLLPFDGVWKILQQGDVDDNYGIVFKCMWFLIRSSMVICDLTRPMRGGGMAQEILYSRQLDIPVVGFLPPAGQINPFVHRSVTAFFSGKDIMSLLPMIKGYAPLQ